MDGLILEVCRWLNRCDWRSLWYTVHWVLRRGDIVTLQWSNRQVRFLAVTPDSHMSWILWLVSISSGSILIISKFGLVRCTCSFLAWLWVLLVLLLLIFRLKYLLPSSNPSLLLHGLVLVLRRIELILLDGNGSLIRLLPQLMIFALGSQWGLQLIFGRLPNQKLGHSKTKKI